MAGSPRTPPHMTRAQPVAWDCLKGTAPYPSLETIHGTRSHLPPAGRDVAAQRISDGRPRQGSLIEARIYRVRIRLSAFARIADGEIVSAR
jgi:hypothetical protein